jgi:ClpP class serine protease
MWWTVLQSVFDDMRAARASGIAFTATQVATFEQQFSAVDTSRVMSVAGDTAEITVRGVLTNTPDMFAYFFGGGNTTYPEINSALAEAEANPDVTQTVMRFISPGGTVNGMFDTIEAMKKHKKPIKAIVELSASASFAISSQADEVVAHNRASMLGSVGVVVDTHISANELSITSTNAPHKRPDLTTPEGKAVLVEQLDAVAALMDEAIAEGRNTTIEKVNADFGKGGILLADEALKRGMIDSVAKTQLHSVKTTNSTTASGGDQPEAKDMDLIKLKAEHPGVYAAAVSEGTAQERDRASAHLTMGAASGDMETALAAVKGGSAMTATLQATYMAAGMNRASVEAAAADSAGAGAADGADNSNEASADADKDASASEALQANFLEMCGVQG